MVTNMDISMVINMGISMLIIMDMVTDIQKISFLSYQLLAYSDDL